jgi:hypothetical protein
MSQLAAEYNAINLSQGFQTVDERLTNIVAKLAKMYINTRLCRLCTHYYQNSDTS